MSCSRRLALILKPNWEVKVQYNENTWEIKKNKKLIPEPHPQRVWFNRFEKSLKHKQFLNSIGVSNVKIKNHWYRMWSVEKIGNHMGGHLPWYDFWENAETLFYTLMTVYKCCWLWFSAERKIRELKMEGDLVGSLITRVKGSSREEGKEEK